MALFGIISSPFSSPLLAIIQGIGQWRFSSFPSAGPRLSSATSLPVISCSLFNFFSCFSALAQPWLSFFFSLKIPERKDGILPLQTEGALLCQGMAAMLRDSVAVVRCCPRTIPLAIITMRKSIHGFPFLSLYEHGARIGGLKGRRAPLLSSRLYQSINQSINF